TGGVGVTPVGPRLAARLFEERSHRASATDGLAVLDDRDRRVHVDAGGLVDQVAAGGDVATADLDRRFSEFPGVDDVAGDRAVAGRATAVVALDGEAGALEGLVHEQVAVDVDPVKAGDGDAHGLRGVVENGPVS